MYHLDIVARNSDFALWNNEGEDQPGHPRSRISVFVIRFLKSRVKSGNLGQQVNSDIHLQTVKIQMRRLLMSRLNRNFTVCLNT